MRMVKATVVAILFLLIPHQAPFARPGDGDRPAATVDRSDAAGSSLTAVDTARAEPVHRESLQASEGFVWSVASSSGAALEVSAEHLETDGYSWSARTAGSIPAVDPAP